MTTPQTITERVLSKLDASEKTAHEIAFRLHCPTPVVRSELSALVREGLVHRTLPPAGTTKASRYRIA